MNQAKIVVRPIIQKSATLISINNSKNARIFIATNFSRITKIWRLKTKQSGFFPKLICYRYTKTNTNQRKKKGSSKLQVKPRSKQIPFCKNVYFKNQISTGLQFKLVQTQYNESFANPDKFAQFKSIVSVIVNSNFSFYQINALSLTRFAFDYALKQSQNLAQKNAKYSKKFIQSTEQELSSRFNGSGAYFKDLVRVSFFAMYLKKADFIANFFASTISKLPRNRKEIPFVHFLVKILKMAASQNPNILGVRIRFQGRLNRWNRTKHIMASKGNVGYFTYNSRIEYGIAQAITRKGTLGVHVWICYIENSSHKFAKEMLTYRNLTDL